MNNRIVFLCLISVCIFRCSLAQETEKRWRKEIGVSFEPYTYRKLNTIGSKTFYPVHKKAYYMADQLPSTGWSAHFSFIFQPRKFLFFDFGACISDKRYKSPESTDTTFTKTGTVNHVDLYRYTESYIGIGIKVCVGTSVRLSDHFHLDICGGSRFYPVEISRSSNYGTFPSVQKGGVAVNYSFFMEGGVNYMIDSSHNILLEPNFEYLLVPYKDWVPVDGQNYTFNLFSIGIGLKFRF